MSMCMCKGPTQLLLLRFDREDCCRFDLLLRPATTSYLFPVRERFQIPSIPDLNILAAANNGSQGKPVVAKQG